MQSVQTTELFTEKSDAYAKYRAGYPEDAIDVILAPFINQKKISIADVGAALEPELVPGCWQIAVLKLQP